MRVRFSRPAGTAFKVILAGALSGLVCFGQNSPQAHAPQASSSPSRAAATSASSPQKVVMRVGNEKVTQAEMDFLIQNLNPRVRQAVAARGRGVLGQQYSMMLLLSRKAVNDHLDTSPDIQREIALQKRQTLAQAEYRKLESQVSVNPQEVSAFYTAHKQEFEQASVREFIVMKKAPGAAAGAPGLSPEQAQARLASIRKAIVAGTPIAQVTKKFEVPNEVIIEPQPRTVHRGQLIPALDKVAFELKDKQFSDPVDTPRAIVAIQVLSRQQPQLKDVSDEIENNLRQQKMQAVVDALKAKTNIWMDPVYFKTPAAQASSQAAPQEQK